MDRSRYNLVVKRHAFVRAMQRGIDPDLIEHTILHGKMQRFGKNYVKFVSKSLVCVGELSGLQLKIFTIEWRLR